MTEPVHIPAPAFPSPGWAGEGTSLPAAERETEPPAPLPMPSNPPGWAVLEIMGHRKRAGWVEQVRVFGTDLARVFLPGDGDRSGWLFEDYSGASIFAISWCDEAMARAAAAEIGRAMQWDRPFALRALPAPRRDSYDTDEPSRGDDPEDPEW